MDQSFQKTMLFDFYGDLLTERQKEFYDLYYNEDLSLAEIAENANITRQGVRDVIVRADAILTEMEEKTGIIARFLEVQHGLQEVSALAGQIADLNDTSIGSQPLADLIGSLQSKVEALKE
ncbi:MAG: DNA-binding protein [Clostridiales bacterium]|nr:DNA-binding protein [Clostridiales bacterium]